MTCLVSIDWGGTSLRAAFIGRNGLIGTSTMPAANIRTLSDERLNEIKENLARQTENIEFQELKWLVGAAGAADTKAAERVKSCLLSISPKGSSCDVYPDYICNHASALGGNDGIISVNGTGSLLFAEFGHEHMRLGGWGYLLDEIPSGAYFGKLVLTCVLDFLEGNSSCKTIYDVYEMNMHPPDRSYILDRLYQAGNIQNHLGSFSKILTTSYDLGDATAQALVNASVERLIDMISRVIESFPATEQANLSFCGGLWENWPTFYNIVNSAITDRNLKITMHEPEYKNLFGPLIQKGKTDKLAASLFKKIPDKEKKR
ncbi:MAG: hypothetical protein Kow0029_18010 [Candidatus Rifleibacteriota bacterium]